MPKLGQGQVYYTFFLNTHAHFQEEYTRGSSPRLQKMLKFTAGKEKILSNVILLPIFGVDAVCTSKFTASGQFFPNISEFVDHSKNCQKTDPTFYVEIQRLEVFFSLFRRDLVILWCMQILLLQSIQVKQPKPRPGRRRSRIKTFLGNSYFGPCNGKTESLEDIGCFYKFFLGPTVSEILAILMN